MKKNSNLKFFMTMKNENNKKQINNGKPFSNLQLPNSITKSLKAQSEEPIYSQHLCRTVM